MVTFGNLLYEPFLNSVDCANKLDVISVSVSLFLGFLKDHSSKWYFNNVIIEELFLTCAKLESTEYVSYKRDAQ